MSIALIGICLCTESPGAQTFPNPISFGAVLAAIYGGGRAADLNLLASAFPAARFAHARQLKRKNVEIDAHKPFALSLSKRERYRSSFDRVNPEPAQRDQDSGRTGKYTK